MKRIAYGESTVGTDDRLADLVLGYATLLARSGGADTVTFPGLVADGSVEAVSMLIGPASQITAWHEDGDLAADVGPAVEELEQRIRLLTAAITPSDEDPGGVDEHGEVEPPA